MCCLAEWVPGLVAELEQVEVQQLSAPLPFDALPAERSDKSPQSPVVLVQCLDVDQEQCMAQGLFGQTSTPYSLDTRGCACHL